MDQNYQSEDILQTLNITNPDSDPDHFYDWSDDFLHRILGSLICDSDFLLQSATLIKPQYFRERAHRFICQTIFDYYDRYNDRPSKAILEAEIEDRYGSSPIKGYYLGELDAIARAYEPGVQKREYFLDKITEFAKTQALRVGYSETLELFRANRKDKWIKIREILQKALMVERNVDLGLPYFENIEQRYARMMKAKESKEFFPCGFDSFDNALGGGLCRGEMGAFAGMSGAGKSLALVKVAKANVMKGWNVLYVSLEMEEDKIAERLDTMLTNIPIGSLYTGRNPQTVKRFLEENKPYWGKFVIKQFPAGTADVVTLRAFIAQLQVNDFRPDCVIVDYVGEFKDVPGLKTYESRQRLVRDLRGMATELDIAVFTAMQVNRSGRDAMKEAGYLDDDSLADSAGQVRPLDALWTISQTEAEQKANVGVLFASKHRSGRGRFKVYFQRDPDTMEMREISDQQYKIELSKVQDKDINEVMLEDYARKSWQPNRGTGEVPPGEKP